MKLMQATIYGFGKWTDYTIDFSTNSFLCIYGENESGKSTLQQFILFVLFGLPPKKRSFFKPKTSGKMGGRLTLFDENVGEFTIERTDDSRNGAAKCFLPNGSEYEEEWLRERLHGMTHKTYLSIFSFSANDLSPLHDMNEDELGEVLLGIGLTGSKNIYSIEKQIDTKIGELFKPYGKKPIINQQLDSLDELYRKLTVYKEEESSYRSKKDLMHSCAKDIQTARETIQKENKTLLSIERQQQALPLIHDYLHCTKQLAGYPAELTFPEDGLIRFQALKEKMLPMQSELSVIEDNLKRYQEKQAKLKEELYDEDIYQQAEEIVQSKQSCIENENRMEQLGEELKKAEIHIDNELNSLNLGLSPDDLATVSFPFHIENTWNQLHSDYGQLQLEKEQRQQEESTLSNQRDYLIHQQQELNASILPRQRIAELNETIYEYKQQASLNKLKEDSFKQHENWQKMKLQKNRTSTNILIGSIIAAVISGGLAFLLDSAIFYSLMAILVVAGAVQWVIGKQSINNMEQMLLSHQETAKIPITKEAFTEAENLIAIHSKQIKERDSVEDQLKDIDRKLLQLDERNNLLEHKQNRLMQIINDQYEEYPFLSNVDLQFWPKLYHTLKHLLQKYDNKIAIQKQRDKLDKDQSQIKNTLYMFFHERNWESTTKTIVEQFSLLEDFLQHFSKTCTLDDQYEKWCAGAMEQSLILKQKISIYEKETNLLFDGALVKTEEAFFQKAKQSAEKRKLDEKANERLGQILTIFKKEEWNELAGRNIDARQLELKHKEHVASIKELEKELDEKRQMLADANADLAKMESTEIYSETVHRYNMEQESLHHLAREWAILKTAKELLIETKRKFRDKYLSKVIDKTSHYFALLTNYAYKRTFAPADGQVFQVLGQDDIKYSVKELSQGTKDQLYIALRLAISEVMSKNHHMPFIIDDAFVHFDASRTKQIMKILTEIAEHQQVILFTCKKDIVETENKEGIVFLENTVRIN
ncbi:ATP-binding protein [Virgibacillus oceani]|uniref:YhaN AAA domain-containing protein n=1 Tax=Virgibacillus oceani TaxID=1479511 RepID=A0A917M3P7_9BACI|nr:AAA family ATPase [Virgibacillus oceani]GGG74873.1 hypothetical protein GCM10011398_19540 [Virgibacillus oceani]